MRPNDIFPLGVDMSAFDQEPIGRDEDRKAYEKT